MNTLMKKIILRKQFNPKHYFKPEQTYVNTTVII